jgi:hypothetical protein
MIDDDLLKLLESRDAEERKRAIKELATTKDPAALKYLLNVYKTDDDPAVRELAAKAGRYIKKATHEQDGTGEKPKAKRSEVSSSDKKRAQGLVKQAMDLSMSGNNEKALDVLSRAFKMNPDLINDQYAVGLLSAVTGLQENEAFEVLEGHRDLTVAKSKRSDKKKKNDDEVTWNTALIDLAIYWLVNVMVLVVNMLLLSLFISQLSEKFTDFSEYSDEFSADFFASEGVIIFLILGFIFGLIYVIFLLVYYAAIHFSALILFGGDGTFTGLVHKLTTFLTIMAVLGSVLTGLNYYYSFSIMLDPNNQSALQNIQSLSMVSSVGSFAALLWFGKLVGDNYKFGIGQGCLSIIAGVILLLVTSYVFLASFLSMAFG